jgi:deazaflavin-dependent oxidoreductase (nitroreductase family)
MSEPEYKAPDLLLVGESHIKAYRESDGEVGYIWNGVTTLLLTSTGRRTGEPRTSALIFGQDGEDCIVIASMGGAPQHPQWYLNVQSNPEAEVQVKGDRFPVIARTATAEEKPRLWQLMVDAWPNYDTYQSRTDRDIPVVVLSPQPR